MRMIWKHQIAPGYAGVIETTKDAKFVYFAEARDGQLYAWVEFDPSLPKENIGYRVFGTGEPIEPPVEFKVGHRFSCQQHGGTFVWHLYEVMPR